MKSSIPSYMMPKGLGQLEDKGQKLSVGKPTGHLAASPADPVLERSFRGHKSTVTSVGFNPNLYFFFTPLANKLSPVA
jgi:hypothetical protein